MCKYFQPTFPCGNCPYRKDAPLALWHIDHFADLLTNDKLQFAPIYYCHKKNGTVCVGWLMNQEERNFPNINLRLKMLKENVSKEYLDSLHCKSERYASIEEMIEANFPELLD